MRLPSIQALSRKRPLDRRTLAKPLLQQILWGIRQPILYSEGGIPDTFEGRFRLLQLFLGLCMARLNTDRAKGRLLLEAAIEEIDGTYREMGVGDMRFSKVMRRSIRVLLEGIQAYKDLAQEMEDHSSSSTKDNWQKIVDTRLCPQTGETAQQNKTKREAGQGDESKNKIAIWVQQIHLWKVCLAEISEDDLWTLKAQKKIFAVDLSLWGLEKP